MTARISARDDVDILNYCAKYLARDSSDPRHDFGQYEPGDFRARVCEPWRFPIVDGHAEGADFAAAAAFNDVTFVFAARSWPEPAREIGVIGTFANLYAPLPLRRLAFQDVEMPYWALTVVVPKAAVYTYKLVVDGQPTVDPINPQRTVLDNGSVWSRFFTERCTQPLSLERWELALLQRLTDHILPFRTAEGQRALEHNLVEKTFLLDQSAGAANFIDKLVSREENHHLIDYKLCLELIDRVLRQRNPFQEPAVMPKRMFVELYEQMGRDDVPGWDYGRYGSPRYFLQLLRRHTFTGAFCHPKYGGNTLAAGWAYLEERYRAADGTTLFDWRRAIERPLGNDPDYHG